MIPADEQLMTPREVASALGVEAHITASESPRRSP